MKHIKPFESFDAVSGVEYTAGGRIRRTTTISKEKAIELYKRNCKEFDKTKPAIYRGIDGSSIEYGYLKPTPGIHRAENGLHNMIINHAENWKEYPKREIICSTSLMTAKSYGWSVYQVIPFDNATFGVCPSSDMWFSFTYSMIKLSNETDSGINAFTDSFRKLQDHINMITTYRIMDYSGLLEYCSAIDDTIDIFLRKKDLLNKSVDMKNLINLIKRNGAYNTVCSIIDPVENGFEVSSISDLQNIGSSIREIWTDSPCLLIENTKIKEFYSQL